MESKLPSPTFNEQIQLQSAFAPQEQRLPAPRPTWSYHAVKMFQKPLIHREKSSAHWIAGSQCPSKTFLLDEKQPPHKIGLQKAPASNEANALS
jgi:hypothetical protein